MGKDEGKAEQQLGTKGFIHKISDLCFGLKEKNMSEREEHALLLPPLSQTILVSQQRSSPDWA